MSERDRRRPSRAQDDPDQYQRFLDAARELECDDSEERFAQVVRRVAKAKVPLVSEPKAGVKTERTAK